MASMAASWSPPVIRLSMGETYSRKKSARKSIIPVKIKNGEVFPAEYHGSAHIHAYTQADGMIEMEIGTESLSKGTLINVRPL
jgi:molybdopterin molybdotransferase